MIKIIEIDNPAYSILLELRNRVLRLPLGMDINDDDLLDESECQHLAYYTEEGKLVGCLKIKHLDENTSQFQQMAVQKDYRGQGIGSKLLIKAESLIRDQGGTEILVEARDYAIPFYIKHGYKKSGAMFEKLNIAHQRMTKSV